mmetsp:Transcript_44111/g.134327  ORF Transcript_44111/g.134327 Transcript_44111/m.134327 type:complete len:238 (-) Transcript_44111:161-874(-)
MEPDLMRLFLGHLFTSTVPSSHSYSRSSSVRGGEGTPRSAVVETTERPPQRRNASKSAATVRGESERMVASPSSSSSTPPTLPLPFPTASPPVAAASSSSSRGGNALVGRRKSSTSPPTKFMDALGGILLIRFGCCLFPGSIDAAAALALSYSAMRSAIGISVRVRLLCLVVGGDGWVHSFYMRPGIFDMSTRLSLMFLSRPGRCSLGFGPRQILEPEHPFVCLFVRLFVVVCASAF